VSSYRSDSDGDPTVPMVGEEHRVVHEPVVEPVVAPTERVVVSPASPATERVVVAPTAPPGTTVVREAVPGIAATDQVVHRSVSAFSPSQIVHGVGAVVLLLIGAIAVARGGFDGPAENQVGSVLGIEMTTPIGLALLAAGLLLAIAALTPSGRPFGGFVGVLVAVGGIVIIAAHEDLQADLRTEPALGWILLVVGIVSVVAAFLPDEVRARRQQVVVR
jgi:hypothetical protein